MNRITSNNLLPDFRNKRIVKLIVPIIICVFSLFVLRATFTSVEFYGRQIRSLDVKKDTVSKLILSSTSSSALLSLIPGDACSAIANKLADLSVALTFILAVLYAEKYLMPILGGLTSILLIPSICMLFIVWFHNSRIHWIKNCIIKLIVLSLACMLIIPTGILVSDTVERIFKFSIDSAINAVLEEEKVLETDIEESETEANESEEQPEEQKGFFDAIGDAANNVVNFVGDTANDVIDSISNTAQNIFSSVNTSVEIAKVYLGSFAEAIAILLITNCVIPLLVFIAFAKVIKYIFSLDFTIADTYRQAASYYKTMKARRSNYRPSDTRR